MALGKPVIATLTGGIPEIIENDVSGILVARENPEEMAEAILKLVENRKLQNRLGKDAKKKAADFSIEKTVNGTVSVYRSCI